MLRLLGRMRRSDGASARDARGGCVWPGSRDAQTRPWQWSMEQYVWRIGRHVELGIRQLASHATPLRTDDEQKVRFTKVYFHLFSSGKAKSPGRERG